MDWTQYVVRSISLLHSSIHSEITSLIYQLLDYERTLQSGNASPNSSILSNHEHHENDETDIGRQNRIPDEQPEQSGGAENPVFAHEAKALDQEMEERKIARKSSQLSVASSSSGMGSGMSAAPIWRSRYGFPALGRNRTNSISSNRSGFSEDIQEEGEEDVRFSSGASPSTMATDEDAHGWPKDVGESDQTITVGVPAPKLLVSIPAASTHKSSFNSISRTRLKGKSKHRPPPLVNLLPPVPSSPLPAAIPIHDPPCSKFPSASPSRSIVSSMRSGHLDDHRLSRSSVSSRSSIRSSSSAWSSSLQTPSQTLLIFPSEDDGGGSTVMLTATPAATAFPVLPSRRSNLSTRKPCLQLGTVSTPTTAFSFVEVKGTNTTSQALKRRA
jgi:tyrosine-protein phosphatase